MPEVLRPLPIRVRPRPAETVASYVVRLARANHLQPSHLHAYCAARPTGAALRILGGWQCCAAGRCRCCSAP